VQTLAILVSTPVVPGVLCWLHARIGPCELAFIDA
jgi:hypothetical protein